VLSSDDPVRVFQRFSTLNAASSGRAEIILGRGSFTESFPLFGYAMSKYEILFEEKLDLFAAILENDRTRQPLSWEGTTRAPLTNQRIYPATERSLPVWIGVGGSPESVVRAARFGFPMMLAIIGGDPRRFGPYVRLYEQTLKQRGAPALPVGMHSPGYIADTDERARNELWPAFKQMHERIGAERGWPPMARETFEQEIERGSLYVGSPETVATKIAAAVKALGVSRFDLKYSSGPTTHDQLMRAVELYGRDVIPRVHALLGDD
jgi:alkanesulfonate monooxygenase SsuD/methylene tetrahydromethanopterin reductase-like flavin-dependent oxidoreductase (luciferase family)